MTEFSGFDDFADQLDELSDQFGEMADNAEDIEGKNQVAFDDLFTQQFMHQHTDADSMDEFIENSPWEVESEEDFEAIPEDEFDEYVDEHTDFDSWEDMLGEAGKGWIVRQIGL